MNLSIENYEMHKHANPTWRSLDNHVQFRPSRDGGQEMSGCGIYRMDLSSSDRQHLAHCVHTNTLNSIG